MEFEIIRKLIADVLNIEEDRISMDSSFEDDLGADSLDLFQIVTEIEQKFRVKVEPESAEKIITVGDAVRAMTNRE